MLIRATDANHVLLGIDLSRLTGALKPSVVVTAADLARIGARVPEFYAGDLLCPFGKTPLYLGQPVALLIFDDFDIFDQARLALRDAPVLKFGEETGPVKQPNYGAFRFTRVGGPTPDAPDVYSPFKNGWVSPGFVENSGAPIWPRLPIPSGAAYAKAANHGEKIRAELAADNPAVLVLDREFETQSVDPMALEPESGLAWYDAGRKDLNLVISVQSPAEMATAIADLLGNGQAPFKPAHININFASCGGGFGGRDHTPFPLYVALAGMFLPNRPVRLANNRFEQFQSGVKRHAFKMRTRIGVDRATGKMVGFVADHALDGGGLANFSAQVGSVSALAALGIYYCPKVDLTTYSFHSRGVTAGSMRCYGTMQTMTALEVQVDEICRQLPLDPIEFRRRNALATGNRNLAGNTYVASIRTPEILDKLEKHPIWARRAEEKARGQQSGILVGTGVACRDEELRHRRRCCAGIRRNRARWPDCHLLRRRRDGQRHWDGSRQSRGSLSGRRRGRSRRPSGRHIRPARSRELRRPLHDGPEDAGRGGAQSALGACDQCGNRRLDRRPCRDTRGSRGRARHLPLRPLASGARTMGHRAEQIARPRNGSKARWQDGQLVMQGLPPLALPAVAAKAHARNGVTGAMAHAFNRWAWARATFAVGGQPWTADIDALAVRRGTGKFVRINRSNVKFPPASLNQSGPTYTAQCGTLVRIEIDRATGALRIAKAYSVLECGQALVPEIVLGQAQGGFAMGVGYALLENAAALRGRARQREMEPRPIPRRARLGPAAARS